MKITLLISAFFLLLSCQSAPKTVARPDWTNVTLYATGFGAIETWSSEERMLGIKLAKASVTKELEEKVLALTTDSGEAFGDKVVKENMMQKVSAFVREAEVVAIDNKPGGVEIQSRLFLGNSFKAAMGLLKRKEIAPPQGRREGSY